MEVCIGAEYSKDIDILTNLQGGKEYTNKFYRDIRLDKLVHTNTSMGTLHRILSETQTDFIEIGGDYGIPYISYKQSQEILKKEEIQEKIASYIKKRLEDNIDTIIKGSVKITFNNEEEQNNILKLKISYSFINKNNEVENINYVS